MEGLPIPCLQKSRKPLDIAGRHKSEGLRLSSAIGPVPGDLRDQKAKTLLGGNHEEANVGISIGTENRCDDARSMILSSDGMVVSMLTPFRKVYIALSSASRLAKWHTRRDAGNSRRRQGIILFEER